MTPSQEKRNRLYQVAESQQGYFTTKQAKVAGYTENNFSHHINSGLWIREYRGIYRLALFPVSVHSQLVLWHLWSRDREDIPRGVYSHETALSIYELSDIMPTRLHMTVPVSFRKNTAIPPVLILHKAELGESDIEQMQGFRVTRPLRALLDLIYAESVSADILKQALAGGLRSGLITRGEIKALTEPANVKDEIQKMMKGI